MQLLSHWVLRLTSCLLNIQIFQYIKMHALTWEPNGIYFKLSGVISIKDVIKLILKIGASPKFGDQLYRITDYTELIDIDKDEIEQIVSFNALQLYSNSRLLDASVTNDQEIFQLLYNQKVTHLAADRMKIFLTLDEARHWIAGNDRS